MKKIYTLLKSSILIASLTISCYSFSQSICGPVAESFDNTAGSTMGFTGDFIIGTTGTDGYLNKSNVISSGIYTITTPTYQLANNATSVGFGFTLGGSEQVARVEAAIIYTSTLNGQITVVLLDQFVPSYNQSTPAEAEVCRAIALSSLPGFPIGGRYRLRFELTPNTGNGQTSQNISFDDFRTNGTLSQSPLPVSFIGFDAKKTSNGVQLIWKVAGEENVARYEVERSIDGRSFTTIANFDAVKKDTYTYLDASNQSSVYYRIRNVDNDGKFKYSSVARISNGKSAIVIKAFPQPVSNQLTVQHPAVKENGLVTISTADGRVIKSIRLSAGSMQTVIDVSTLQKGMYLVRFNGSEGEAETLKVIKQ